jgi:hypothetical protein
MEDNRMVKKLTNWKPFGKKPARRSKNRWIDGILKDIQVLKVKNWKELIGNRKEWNNLVGFRSCLPHHVTGSYFLNKNNVARLHLLPYFLTGSRICVSVQYASTGQHSTAGDVRVLRAELSTPRSGVNFYVKW